MMMASARGPVRQSEHHVRVWPTTMRAGSGPGRPTHSGSSPSGPGWPPAPGLANSAIAAPLLGSLARRAAGIEPRRQAPELAGQTFRDWFGRHEGPDHGTEVLLWPDTFTN
jgi:hypothetical protein